VNLGATGVAKNIWYAGSPENMGFRDLRDNTDGRGYLRVTLDDDGSNLRVSPVQLPTRPMFRLPVADGSGLDGDGIVEKLIENIKSAEMSGAVVGQVVAGVNRDLWSLVDVSKVRGAAKDALHYEITVKYPTETTEHVERPNTVDAFDQVLAAQVESLVPEQLRGEVRTKARTLIGSSQVESAS
jgi:hypothetical protein